MAGQGILIIIIPNDLNNEQIVKEPSELPIKTNNTTTDIEYSKGYPCSVCGASLASRFRYHISPKLNLIDAIWILSENHQHFFMTCFTELGQHSDVILEELRLAEIGIRQGSKVLILPLACALGIENLLSASPTIVEINGLNNTINEITNSNESESLINNDNELNQRLGTNKSDFKRSILMPYVDKHYFLLIFFFGQYLHQLLLYWVY